MHWRCPHCHSSLTVPEDKRNAKTLLARCYQCNGLAFVNRERLEKKPIIPRTAIVEAREEEVRPSRPRWRESFFDFQNAIFDFISFTKWKLVGLAVAGFLLMSGYTAFNEALIAWNKIKAQLQASNLDKISQSSSAPRAARESESPMYVKVMESRADLRSGPGLEYPIVARTVGGRVHQVRGWSSIWFKIQLNTKDPRSTYWIRNDEVQMVSR